MLNLSFRLIGSSLFNISNYFMCPINNSKDTIYKEIWNSRESHLFLGNLAIYGSCKAWATIYEVAFQNQRFHDTFFHNSLKVIKKYLVRCLNIQIHTIILELLWSLYVEKLQNGVWMCIIKWIDMLLRFARENLFPFNLLQRCILALFKINQVIQYIAF